MLKKVSIVTLLALALAAPGAEGRQNAVSQAPAAAQAPVETKSQVARPVSANDPVNIRLDLTISVTDQRGVALWPAKVATLHAIDADRASIRVGQTSGAGPVNPSVAVEPTPILNIDAQPRLVGSGRVRVTVSFEYRPGAEVGKGVPIHVNERLSAVLDDGKPVVVSQTPDPSADRIVKVELKASIVR